MAKTKALISFAVTAKLICVFVFAYAKIRFSHNEAQIMYVCILFRSNIVPRQRHRGQSNSTFCHTPPFFCLSVPTSSKMCVRTPGCGGVQNTPDRLDSAGPVSASRAETAAIPRCLLAPRPCIAAPPSFCKLRLRRCL